MERIERCKQKFAELFLVKFFFGEKRKGPFSTIIKSLPSPPSNFKEPIPSSAPRSLRLLKTFQQAYRQVKQ
jgi:hypothetical protein